MKTALFFTIMLMITLAAYLFLAAPSQSVGTSVASLTSHESGPSRSQTTERTDGLALATFAGGCFWCLEGPYDKLDGVISTTSGYAGGHTVDPEYREVSSGRTGHTEVVQIVYDPELISYQQLLDVFWVNIDPTTLNRQFCDSGSQYRTAIFYHDDDQRKLAEATAQVIDETADLPGPVVTEIAPLDIFYPAEDYHQDYYIKNPLRYNFYRTSCGRDKRLKELWGNKADH